MHERPQIRRSIAVVAMALASGLTALFMSAVSGGGYVDSTFLGRTLRLPIAAYYWAPLVAATWLSLVIHRLVVRKSGSTVGAAIASVVACALLLTAGSILFLAMVDELDDNMWFAEIDRIATYALFWFANFGMLCATVLLALTWALMGSARWITSRAARG